LRTYGGEKLLHRCRVAIKKFAIQIPWVPINKNAAEIEHGDRALSHEEKILTERAIPVEVSSLRQGCLSDQANRTRDLAKNRREVDATFYLAGSYPFTSLEGP